MLDKRIQIWNLLHDGEIIAISENNLSLTMFISISYLRRRLPPLVDSFVLTLSGLNSLEFVNFDGTKTSLRTELEIGAPEILSTSSEVMPIKMKERWGGWNSTFRQSALLLDSGQPFEFEVIRKASEEYWEEWESKRGSSSS